MKKFEGILFCTDLDGTLYSDDKAISKQNLEAIEYFKSEGGLFTFITGRVPKISWEICNIIKPNAPYGCINGGGIYDILEDKYLWKVILPEDVLELVRVVDKELPEMGIQFNTEKEIYFNKDNSAMEYFRAVTGVPNIACNYEDVTWPVLKIVFAHDNEEQIYALMDILKNHPKAEKFDFIRSEKRLYEILPKGVNKGSALYKLAEILGIARNKTIAVGDYDNDVSMLRTAGLSFAVENAVEKAKAVSDYITVSNNNHAIAKIIEGLDKGDFTVKAEAML